MGGVGEQKGLQRCVAWQGAGSPAMEGKENAPLGGWGSAMEWHAAPADAWPRPEPPQGCSSPAVGHGACRAGP